MKELQKLRHALLISGVVNLLLLTAVFYLIFKERPPMPYVALKPATKTEELPRLADTRSQSEIVSEMSKLSFEELILNLRDATLVENGLKRRDFALAILVHHFSFDLKRALGTSHVLFTPRLLQTSLQEPLIVYTGLTDANFQTLSSFASREKWPLTPQGLFMEALDPIKRGDLTLQQAFFLTPEFQAVETLFKRSPTNVEPIVLYSALLEGSWKMLADFLDKQNRFQDLREPQRQQFLLNYIHQGSVSAARLILKTDREFALKKLDDQHLMAILKLLDPNESESETFAREIIKSPRSDACLELSYQIAKEKRGEGVLKSTESSKTVFENSLPKQIVKFSPQKTKGKEEKLDVYIIQDGDSLWKIAKKHKVSIDEIRKVNHLSSDMLKIGASLRIPKT